LYKRDSPGNSGAAKNAAPQGDRMRFQPLMSSYVGILSMSRRS